MIRATSHVRDERGIASLMVAVSAVAVFGSAAIAVDLGNLWASRRNVITATDAAALAAAADYAVGKSGCAIAPGYVTDNDADAAANSCDPVLVGPSTGYVTVSADTPVDYAFAGILGIPDRRVGSATAAGWGIPSGVNGLRPFGLCRDDPNFVAWVANPRGQSAPAKVFYTHAGTNCGGAPGNWAILDLDNIAPVSNSDTKRWIHRGYQGLVRPGNMGGDPGAISNSLDPDLGVVLGEEFPIPVFDRVSAQGRNAKFHVVGFVGIELVGWQTTGAESQRYLKVKFTEMVAAGDCCEPAALDFGLRTIHICDVDPDFDPLNCRS